MNRQVEVTLTDGGTMMLTSSDVVYMKPKNARTNELAYVTGNNRIAKLEVSTRASDVASGAEGLAAITNDVFNTCSILR